MVTGLVVDKNLTKPEITLLLHMKLSRAAAKHTTVVSLFRINVRPSVQHKCHFVRPPWYQMLTSWAQPGVAAVVGP